MNITPGNASKEIFTCQYPGCNKHFSTKFSLKRHQGIHFNIKAFMCNYCGKKFALSQYLKEHSYCHTMERFYVCKINGCQKAFRHANDISLHRRTHPEFQVCRHQHARRSLSPGERKNIDCMPRVIMMSNKRFKEGKKHPHRDSMKYEHTINLRDCPIINSRKSMFNIMEK